MISFTIITCTYNAARHLPRTLESVRQQRYAAVEHLIVDGLSTDESVALASDYKARSDAQQNGHAVRIISERDKGLYNAMNKARHLATGQYVLYLNAGDTFPSADTLAQVAAAAEGKTPLPAVLYGQTDIVDEEGHFLRHRRLAAPKHLTWRSFRHGMVVCHQAFYARTDLVKEVEYSESLRYSADVDWCIRIMKKADQQRLPLVEVPAVVAHFMDGGLTTQHHRASLRERFDVMRRHYGLFPTVALHLWFVLRAVIKK